MIRRGILVPSTEVPWVFFLKPCKNFLGFLPRLGFSHMKDPFDRTKVVLRHLPPSISQSALMEQIDGRFAGRYDWACFRPGKARLGFRCLFLILLQCLCGYFFH